MIVFLKGTASAGRRLHGRRGLKLFILVLAALPLLSPPSRAAWIEIFTSNKPSSIALVAAFTGGVD